MDSSIVQAHQHSADAKKGGLPMKLNTVVVGASTKIDAVVDAYGYLLYLMISQEHKNDINYAIPLLEHTDI